VQYVEVCLQEMSAVVTGAKLGNRGRSPDIRAGRPRVVLAVSGNRAQQPPITLTIEQIFRVKAISSKTVHVDLDLAGTLFGQLEARHTVRTAVSCGTVTGPGEQAAHDIIRAAGERIGLEVSIDAIGNLAMTLPGKDRRTPRIVIGSHLDSVPQGGNFDGAAGVVAGTMCLAGSAVRQVLFRLATSG